MAERTRPSIERLRELLEYNPETGILRWRVQRAAMKAGDRAGSLHHTGYRVVRVDGVCFMEHQVAWALHHGEWPPEGAQIDHKDLNTENNRLNNLRICSQTENLWNRPLTKANSSGFKGVSYYRRNRKWGAHIRLEGKLKYLGSYATPEEAHAAYCAAAEKHHGEFARTA